MAAAGKGQAGRPMAATGAFQCPAPPFSAGTASTAPPASTARRPAASTARRPARRDGHPGPAPGSARHPGAGRSPDPSRDVRRAVPGLARCRRRIRAAAPVRLGPGHRTSPGPVRVARPRPADRGRGPGAPQHEGWRAEHRHGLRRRAAAGQEQGEGGAEVKIDSCPRQRAGEARPGRRAG